MAGGGTAYVNAVGAVDELVGQLEGDEKTGAQIIANALTAPVKPDRRQRRSWMAPSFWITSRPAGKTGYGFDAYKEVYVRYDRRPASSILPR